MCVWLCMFFLLGTSLSWSCRVCWPCWIKVKQQTMLCLQEALLGWKSGKAQVLVATDVAARGLHIKNMPYVINYDFPTNLDTYVHRVGRTGRLATNGHAYSFFTRNLAPLAKLLLALLKVCVV